MALTSTAAASATGMQIKLKAPANEKGIQLAPLWQDREALSTPCPMAATYGYTTREPIASPAEQAKCVRAREFKQFLRLLAYKNARSRTTALRTCDTLHQ